MEMNKINNIELRRLNPAPAEFRVESVAREDGSVDKYIAGYAAVFEQYSTPIWGEFVEIISRNAFDNADMSDVVMCIDHSRAVQDVIARSRNGEGSLSISIDDHGLAFRFLVPDTSVGRDLVQLIERGDISECSFAFYTRSDKWTYDQAVVDGVYDIRRVEEVAKLVDMSIVVNGQYPQTSVSVDERSLIEASRTAQRPTPKVEAAMTVELAKMITNI